MKKVDLPPYTSPDPELDAIYAILERDRQEGRDALNLALSHALNLGAQ
jgi:hypothetical protein